MVIVHSGGFSYKHKEPAKSGDIWIHRYYHIAVMIKEIYNLEVVFVTLSQSTKTFSLGKTDFYSLYEKGA